MSQQTNEMFLSDDKRLIATVYEDEKQRMALKQAMRAQGNLKELLPLPKFPLTKKP